MSYSPEIERDEQGRAARVVFTRAGQHFDDAPASGVTPHASTQDGILRCVCGKLSAPKGRFCSRQCKDRAYNLAHPVARQRSLPLDPEPQPIPQVVDQRVPLPDCEGLAGDNALVLARLRQGPATTYQLHEAAPRSMAIHSRVSDVRQHLERRRLGSKETVARRRIGPRLHLYFIEAVL